MKTFTDNAKRPWEVDVHVTAIERVRAATGIDLLSAVDPQAHLFDTLAGDPVRLVGVLYTLCQEQAERQEITPETFGRAMAGDALDAGCQALEEATIDFFPRLRRTLLHQGTEKMRAQRQRAFEAAAEYLESPEFEARMLDRLRQLKDSFGAALDSSASILAGGPSAGSARPSTPASDPSGSAASDS